MYLIINKNNEKMLPVLYINSRLCIQHMHLLIKNINTTTTNINNMLTTIIIMY